MQAFDGQIQTACGLYGSETGPFYCPGDQSVYLVSAFMQDQMSTFGKFGPAMIIGHEIGHHVQYLLGVQETELVKELQADCLAGVWVKDAGARGLLEKGDYLEAWNNFTALGDAPWFGRTHGTVQERQFYFQRGFQFGLTGC